MRGVFSATVKDSRASVAEGTFDSTGIEDGWADLVVIAQVCSLSILSEKQILIPLFRHSIGVLITTKLVLSLQGF